MMWFVRFLVAGFVAFVCGMVFLYASVRRSATLQPTRPADVIIVLGSGSWGGKPSPVYQARLDRAFELYSQQFAPRIIVTERAPAAQVAKRYLLAKGAPDEVVFVEDRSATTWENLHYAREIMQQHGWRSAIVASCPFHLFRALKMCSDLGIPAQGAASSSPLETNAGSRFSYSLAECRKYIAYKWFRFR